MTMLAARTRSLPAPEPTSPLAGSPPLVEQGRYSLRLAETESEIDAAFRLRFEVFNLELGEGLRRSLLTGRDQDEFDDFCRHLVVVDRHTGATVGTYRVQTGDDAARGHGFYTATEFDLSAMPGEILGGSLELGRACIARAHRNTRVLYLLWRGIAEIAQREGKRWLFGCCSLTSRDPGEGRALLDVLARREAVHPRVRVRPRPGFACWPTASGAARSVEVPRLFDMYLAMGARVCSEPAIDRAFGTIDFVVLFDLHELDPRSRRRFLPREARP
ncbi:MAG TPA: GNAT family N-acyltransferase [Candidatus Binatia bacterium]|nr:GNAT family N-acyltransferase [Candidatus Binatia bacterium]